MGKIIKNNCILSALFFVLSFSTNNVALAQQASANNVIASTIIQQKYVKYPWQQSGGVFMIIVDVIASNAFSNYSRKAYFRYLDESDYLTSLKAILPDNCIENLQLNTESAQQSATKLNSTISSEGHCPDIVYDAQKYQGFYDSQSEHQFSFDALKTYNPNHAYQLVLDAYNYVKQNLTWNNGRITYRKINERYIAVRVSMNGKPFEEPLSIRRSIMSGLKPLLEKMSAFCNHKSNSANNRWTRLKANSDLLYTQIENAYGNEGKF